MANSLSTYDIQDIGTQAAVNAELNNVTSAVFATPYNGLERVRKALGYVHINIPNVKFMGDPAGRFVFEVKQFGEQAGIDTEAQKVETPDSGLFVYFEYAQGQDGLYRVFASIVTTSELEDLMDDDLFEPDDEDEEPDLVFNSQSDKDDQRYQTDLSESYGRADYEDALDNMHKNDTKAYHDKFKGIIAHIKLHGDAAAAKKYGTDPVRRAKEVMKELVRENTELCAADALKMGTKPLKKKEMIKEDDETDRENNLLNHGLPVSVARYIMNKTSPFKSVTPPTKMDRVGDGKDDPAEKDRENEMASGRPLSEGIKEYVKGAIRRSKDPNKVSIFQNRRDVAHSKAADAYAKGETRKGDKYLTYREKSAKKEGIDLKNPLEEARKPSRTSIMNKVKNARYTRAVERQAKTGNPLDPFKGKPKEDNQK